MQDKGRWHLTDTQGFVVALLIVTAVFVAAMAWGSSSLPLLLIAALLIVLAGLAVFLLGLGHNARRRVTGSAIVLAVNQPPSVSIVGRCDMRLQVQAAQRELGVIRFRDPSVAIVKWPRVGQRLPVEVRLNNARQLRVLWDHFDQTAATVPTSLYPTYSPTPATPTTPTVPTSPGPAGSARPTASTVRVYTDYADPTDHTGFSEYAEYGDLMDDDGTEATARDIPAPRPANEPDDRASSAQPDPGGHAMGGMLAVSNLDRSLRFYSDVVGFTIVHASSNDAVIEYGGARLLLQQVADFAPVERRVTHFHIVVPDLDTAYAQLMAKGVEFTTQPRLETRSDTEELWKATFRDPDGHAIALTEWRQRKLFD